MRTLLRHAGTRAHSHSYRLGSIVTRPCWLTSRRFRTRTAPLPRYRSPCPSSRTPHEPAAKALRQSRCIVRRPTHRAHKLIQTPPQWQSFRARSTTRAPAVRRRWRRRERRPRCRRRRRCRQRERSPPILPATHTPSLMPTAMREPIRTAPSTGASTNRSCHAPLRRSSAARAKLWEPHGFFGPERLRVEGRCSTPFGRYGRHTCRRLLH